MAQSWALLVAVVGILTYFSFNQKKLANEKQYNVLNATYDYIIVGAGSAGCVLANRLSEDLLSTVLIVEAGGSEEENENMHIPALPGLLLNTKTDWAYKTVPQKKACMAFKDQKSAWPRGKVLGGSSSINYMHYMRGSRHDFDGWAKEGCQGWNYKDVLPYFIKSEDIQIPSLKTSAYHGVGGPLTVSDGASTSLVDRVYRRGMEELGYQAVDCNGESQTENKKAVGITFIKDNVKHVVKANKEVIISSGAVNSPQLLMLSGIGPKEHLSALKIPVEADLPIGNNLEDHTMLFLLFRDNSSSGLSPSMWSHLQYQLFRSEQSNHGPQKISETGSGAKGSEHPLLTSHTRRVLLVVIGEKLEKSVDN
uniref:Glucose dehydrogenase [acceptor] n=1 Tax=Magallana gigas TaxID=29159 RepID=K1QLR0_MAGGI